MLNFLFFNNCEGYIIWGYIICLPCRRLEFDSLGQEDPLEEEMVTHPSVSCLENYMDRGTWQATVHWVSRVRYNWATKLPPSGVLISWGKTKKYLNHLSLKPTASEIACSVRLNCQRKIWITERVERGNMLGKAVHLRGSKLTLLFFKEDFTLHQALFQVIQIRVS